MARGENAMDVQESGSKLFTHHENEIPRHLVSEERTDGTAAASAAKPQTSPAVAAQAKAFQHEEQTSPWQRVLFEPCSQIACTLSPEEGNHALSCQQKNFASKRRATHPEMTYKASC